MSYLTLPLLYSFSYFIGQMSLTLFPSIRYNVIMSLCGLHADWLGLALGDLVGQCLDRFWQMNFGAEL